MTVRHLNRTMLRLVLAVLGLVAFAHPAAAKVDVHFHSFNGSALFGRYPHTFVVFEGTLEGGHKVDENFGFSAKRISPAILTGPVEHTIYVEEQKYIAKTNRHFTVTVDDATYRKMRAEIDALRVAKGKLYDLDKYNCIHFVGRMAQLAGLKVDYPKNLLRKPRAWLNRVGTLNPKLGAKPITG